MGPFLIVPARERPAGWETRLAEQISFAARKHFHPKDWNCARFAHTCAQAVARRALPFRWKGSLEESVDAVLARYPDVKLARRGDVVLASLPEPSLGICTGAHALFVTAAGLREWPLARCSVAWVV